MAFYEIARCKRNYKTFSKYFSKPFVTSSLLWCLRSFWSTFLCPIMLAIAVVEADLFGTKKSLDADILPLEEASLLPYFHNSLLYVEGETFLPLGHGLIILISMFRYIVMNVTFYSVYILISYIARIELYVYPWYFSCTFLQFYEFWYNFFTQATFSEKPYVKSLAAIKYSTHTK